MTDTSPQDRFEEIKAQFVTFIENVKTGAISTADESKEVLNNLNEQLSDLRKVKMTYEIYRKVRRLINKINELLESSDFDDMHDKAIEIDLDDGEGLASDFTSLLIKQIALNDMLISHLLEEDEDEESSSSSNEEDSSSSTSNEEDIDEESSISTSE